MPADDGPISAQADRVIAALDARQAIAYQKAFAAVGRMPATEGDLDRDHKAAAKARSTILNMLRNEMAKVLATTEARALDAAEAATNGVQLKPPAIARIDKAVDRMLTEIEGIFAAGADDIRRTIDASVRARAPLAKLMEDAGAKVDGIFARAKSAADAAVMAAGRAATIEATEAEDGEPMAYVYLGPTDGKVRPFCRKHVGKAFTRAALDRLDNGDGQPKPVSVYMGGWGCRHMPSPITIKDAIKQGYKIKR